MKGAAQPGGCPLLLRAPSVIAGRPLPVVALLIALVARVDGDPEERRAGLVLHRQLVVLRHVDVVLSQPPNAHRRHVCVTSLGERQRFEDTDFMQVVCNNNKVGGTSSSSS